MCAILGISLMNGSTFRNNVKLGTLLQTLFLECEPAGRNATGVAFCSRDHVRVLKKDVRASIFVKSVAYTQAVRAFADVSIPSRKAPISILGHCRLKTQGTEKNNVNNHPIIADNIIGIHNGVIGNDGDLFRRFMEQYHNFERAGEVDTEIIFRLLNHYINQSGNESMSTKTAIIQTIKHLQGSYACAFINRRNPYLLWLFRNRNPTTIYCYPKLGLIIYATTKKAIDTAASIAGIAESPVNLNMSKEEAIGINLYTNRITRLDMFSVLQRKALGSMAN